MIVTTGGRETRSSSLSSMSSSTVFVGVWTSPLPRSRFLTSKRKPYLAQILCATFSSMAWLTLAKTPASIRSAMILKGFCLSCSARSRTTMGGLMVMTWASAGSKTFGVVLAGSVDRPAPAVLDWPCPLAPGMVGPDGATLPPRTPRISPRLLKSVRRWSIGRPGSLAPPGFSAGLAPGLGRNWMNPTLSPTLGPDGGGGGGGGASTTGTGFVSGGSSLETMGGLSIVGGAGEAGASAAGAAAAAAGAGAGAATASGWRLIWTASCDGAAGAAIGCSDGGGVATGGGAGGGGGGGGGAASSGYARMSCCSRYSAVILSSELEATRAAVRFNSFALANTCLLSKPSFFEMSYIRTGIFIYRFEPCLPYRLHRLDPNLPELLAASLTQPAVGGAGGGSRIRA